MSTVHCSSNYVDAQWAGAIYCADNVSTPALTTVFTPPSSCFGSIYTLSETTTPSGYRIYDNVSAESFPTPATTQTSVVTVSGITSTQVTTATSNPGETLAGTLYRGVDPACFPSDFWLVAGPSASTNVAVASFYSPGICPEGYTTAVQSATGNASLTTGICCPAGYDFGTSASSIKAGDTTTVDVCSFDLPFLYTVYSVPSLSSGPLVLPNGRRADVTVINGSSTITYPATLQQIDQAFATPITVINGPGDAAAIASSSASVASATSSPGTTNAPNSPDGLSIGAKAGIGVGVGIGALVLVLVGVFVWRRRRAQQTAPSKSAYGDALNEFGKAELSGEGKQPAQLDHGQEFAEVNGASKPAEVGNDTVRAELEGEWRGWEAPGTYHR